MRVKREVEIGIYKITNMVNGKAYVGQSVDIYKRWCSHRIAAFKKESELYEYPIYRAIRKYGLENFCFEIVERCEKKKLSERERFWISYYDTFFNGYNQTFGGEATKTIPKEYVIGIFHDLENTNLTLGEIAKNRNVSIETVCAINTGRRWHHDREYPIRKNKEKTISKCPLCGKRKEKTARLCKECWIKEVKKTVQGKHVAQIKQDDIIVKPNEEELKDLILKNQMTIVAKMFGVTDNAVRRWCKGYGLPTSKIEIEKMRQQLGITEYNKTKQPITLGPYAKKINRYDLDGNLIETYDSTGEAAKAVIEEGIYHSNLHTARTKIKACCHKKLKTIYNCLWSYA